MILHIILLIGIVLVAGILVHQIYGWQSGRMAISRKQKVYRVLAAVFVICVLAMVLNGDKSLMAHQGALAVIYYWMVCFILAVTAAFLAMLDVRDVSIRWREQRKANILELIDPREEDKKDE